MLIGGTATAVTFVIFIAPGAFWLWRAEHRRAPLPRSQLMEAALVTLASAVFSTPALLLTGLLLWAVDHDFSTFTVWWRSGGSPSGQAALGYAALLLAQLAIAIGLAELAFVKFGERLLGELATQPVSAWTKVFRYDKRDPSLEAMAEILLDDGSIIRGIVQYYTPDHPLTDRELVLAAPILHELDGRSVYSGRPTPSRVILPAGVIRSLAVRYIKLEDVQALPPK